MLNLFLSQFISPANLNNVTSTEVCPEVFLGTEMPGHIIQVNKYSLRP